MFYYRCRRQIAARDSSETFIATFEKEMSGTVKKACLVCFCSFGCVSHSKETASFRINVLREFKQTGVGLKMTEEDIGKISGSLISVDMAVNHLSSNISLWQINRV